MNRMKGREEWKQLIHKMTPGNFQHLSYDLIQSYGFVNPKPRGKGGDGGRDIEASFPYKFGREDKVDKCWFQAKRYRSGINFRDFSTEAQKADDQGVDRFVIMSNTDSTPACKDNMKNWNDKHRCKIEDWTGDLFLNLLFSSRSICNTYFPDEEIPPIVNQRYPGEAITQSRRIGNRFGIEISIDPNKKFNPQNPKEVAEVLKEVLINLKNVDDNLKAFIYQQAGLLFSAIGQIDDGVMFLDKSLEISPQNVQTHLTKALLYEREKKHVEAAKSYQDILEFDPKNKFALSNLAINLRQRGEIEEALSYAEAAIEIDGNFLQPIITKAELLRLSGNTDDALSFIEQQKDELKNTEALKTSQVECYIDNLDLKKAHDLNEEIIASNPKNLDAINNKGVIYDKNANFQKKEKYLAKSLECFNDLMKKDSKYELGWSNSVAILLSLKDISKAKEIVDIAYALFPNDAYILQKKGALLAAEKKYKDALKYYNRSINLRYQQQALIERGVCHLNLKHWKEALAEAERILQKNPKYSDAFEMKAIALEHLHQFAKARIFRKKAQELRKKYVSLLEEETTDPVPSESQIPSELSGNTENSAGQE